MNRKHYAVMAFFSLAGLAAAFWQLLDKIFLLKHPAASLACNLNSVFNCGRVLNSHQYEVFGFPNAMIGIVMFTFFLTVAIVGLSGGRLPGRFRQAAQGLALFMLGFILWFLYQSTYRIHAICLFCTVIGPSVLIINAMLFRLNLDVMPGKWAKRLAASGADIFIWSLLTIGAVFAIIMEFR